MRNAPHIKMTKQEFICEKRKQIKEAKKAAKILKFGCVFIGCRGKFCDLAREIEHNLDVMYRLTLRPSKAKKTTGLR